MQENSTKVGMVFLVLYLFSLFGRLPEITTNLLGTSFYQTAILGVLTFAATLSSHGLQRALKARLGILMIALHGWLLVAAPFSHWRSGTLQAFSFVFRYFPIFLFMGGLILTCSQYRKIMIAIAASVLMDMLWIFVSSTGGVSSRLELADSRFSNSNEIAIYLLIGLPFLLFVMLNPRYKAIMRLLAVGAVTASLFMAVRTGSRGGLITMGVLFLLIWLSTSIINKISLLVIAAILGTLLYMSMSATLRNRFATIDNQQARDTTGAVSSTTAREALLRQSIDVTLEHPLVGVGLGVYAAAAAGESHDRGERAMWQVTHNAYTQMSAESGIPALFLYVSILFLCLKETYKIRKLSQTYPQLKELSLMAGCIFLATVSFCISGCFTSIALDFYFYTLVGFVIALSNIAQRELRLVSIRPRPAPLAGLPARFPTPARTVNPRAKTSQRFQEQPPPTVKKDKPVSGVVPRPQPRIARRDREGR